MNDNIRLNNFLSRSGIASRRKADILIKSGTIEVNGKFVTKVGTIVNSSDIIRFNGERIKIKKKIYILINKPKGFITSTKDQFGRKTVMDLIPKFFYTKYKIFPIGRLDRSSTGILLLTNDGKMSSFISHPRYKIQKIYNVNLNKKILYEDLNKIKLGKICLREGRVCVNFIKIIKYHKIKIGVYLGWNKIIKRIFRKLNYRVTKLDRIKIGKVSKKNLKLGHWKFIDIEDIL